MNIISKKIDFFNKASGFSIYLHLDNLGIHSDFFFESIPDEYLGVNKEDFNKEIWNWKEGEENIPMIMPKDFLKILNLELKMIFYIFLL